jgi:hypothetical protein
MQQLTRPTLGAGDHVAQARLTNELRRRATRRKAEVRCSLANGCRLIDDAKSVFRVAPFEVIIGKSNV